MATKWNNWMTKGNSFIFYPSQNSWSWSKRRDQAKLQVVNSNLTTLQVIASASMSFFRVKKTSKSSKEQSKILRYKTPADAMRWWARPTGFLKKWNDEKNVFVSLKFRIRNNKNLSVNKFWGLKNQFSQKALRPIQEFLNVWTRNSSLILCRIRILFP